MKIKIIIAILLIGVSFTGCTKNSQTSAMDPASNTDSGGDGDSDTSGSNDAAYANVTKIPEITGDAGAYTFNVTVESSDIDCSQFANWWEVLSEDGELIYRRILQHPHTDANGTSDPDAPGNTFTRDGGPVAIDSDEVVIVRAHMSNGGYNGTVLRGSVDSGFTEATDIASTFASSVETKLPLPDGCIEM